MTRFTAILSAVLLLVTLAGCDATDGDSIYDEGRELGADPQISSVEPEDQALSGIGTITIEGENFSANPEDLVVFFGGERATIMSASETQLQVRPPNAPGVNIPLRVSVLGAENFATVTYTLLPTVEPFGRFTQAEDPEAIAGDASGNIYTSLMSNGTPDDIIRITPEGERSTYAPAESWTYSDMRFGPDGALYTVRGLAPIIYRIPPGGGDAEVWLFLQSFPQLGTLDFDAAGNIWAGGNNESIYRIDSQQNVETFPFEGNVRSLRVFDGELYAAVVRDSVSSIWRAPIDGSGNLGTFDEYVDLSAEPELSDGTALALAFAQDGTMYVGTDGSAGIVTVSANGDVAPYYPGLFHPAITSLAWGSEPFLYGTLAPTDEALMEDQSLTDTILKINTQKEGAR